MSTALIGEYWVRIPPSHLCLSCTAHPPWLTRAVPALAPSAVLLRDMYVHHFYPQLARVQLHGLLPVPRLVFGGLEAERA